MTTQNESMSMVNEESLFVDDDKHMTDSSPIQPQSTAAAPNPPPTPNPTTPSGIVPTDDIFTEHQEEKRDEGVEAEEDEEEELPVVPLDSYAPAIFVPIPVDLFAKRPNPPTTEVARLRRDLADLMEHSARVRENLIALCRRECLRLARSLESVEKRDAEAEARLPKDSRRANPSSRDGHHFMPSWNSTEHDIRLMIENMLINDPSLDHRITDIPLFDITYFRATTPRQQLTKDLYRQVWDCVRQLRGHNEHVTRLRRGFEHRIAALQKPSE